MSPHRAQILILMSVFWIMCFGLCQTFAEETDAVNPSHAKKKRIQFWGELYNESTVIQKIDDNMISFSHIRQGIRAHCLSRLVVETYVLFRYGKDLHRDFWNNRYEVGLGLRTRMPLKIFLALYVEWIRGCYIKVPEDYPQPDKKMYSDFRSGVIFWHGWEKTYPISKFVSLKPRFWGDLYGDVSYYREQRNNCIGYFHSKLGFRLIRFWKADVCGYGVMYLAKDINEDFWNNKIEGGAGIWLSPIPDLDFKMYAEWLFGSYFGIEGVDPNPYAQQYRDRRIGILFWIGW
jgi:hypothetical protein